MEIDRIKKPQIRRLHQSFVSIVLHFVDPNKFIVKSTAVCAGGRGSLEARLGPLFLGGTLKCLKTIIIIPVG